MIPLDPVLQVVIAVLALALGVWLGLPGRFDQSPDDIEALMERGGSHRRKATRHFMFINWLRRDARASDRRVAERRRHFRTATPDRDPEDGR